MAQFKVIQFSPNDAIDAALFKVLDAALKANGYSETFGAVVAINNAIKTVEIPEILPTESKENDQSVKSEN